MIVGIPVYNDVDLLDVTAPFEILKWMDPKIDLRLIAPKPGKITARSGGFTFEATADVAPPDLALFAYFIDAFGTRIEIVDRALFPDFPAFLQSAAPPADA